MRTYHKSWIERDDEEPLIHCIMFWQHDDGSYQKKPTTDHSKGWHVVEAIITRDSGEPINLTAEEYASECEKALSKLKEELNLT
jgi:hypothetical protein